jgi:prevent-host-death family protein
MSAEQITATAFHRTIGAFADQVRSEQRTFIVTSNGRPQMVLMPYSRYVELTGDALPPTALSLADLSTVEGRRAYHRQRMQRYRARQKEQAS